MDIVILNFETVYKNGKARDRVYFGPRDGIQNSVTVDYIANMDPTSLIEQDEGGNQNLGSKINYMRARWAVIEPAYNAWKASGEIPENGIPIKAWAGVNSDQARVLVQHGIKSVEDLAAMGDSAVTKIPLPDLRSLREQAKTFLDGRGAAEMAGEVSNLREELEAAKALLAELTKPKEPAKPRGRPKAEAA